MTNHKFPVIVVDDERLIAKNIAKNIERCNSSFQVVSIAHNGEDALSQIQELRPSFLFTDIRMPVMDGLAATRCIRESDHSDSKTVPIVAMTANVFEEDVKKSFDAGMNAHLSKPVDIKQMYAVLDELVTGDGLL